MNGYRKSFISTFPLGKVSKPVVGLSLGIILGIFDGLTALLTPEVAPMITGIIIGSSIKGLIVGLIIGFFARKVKSVSMGLLFGSVIGLLFAFLVALTPDESGKHYWLEIMIPGTLVGLILGYATQKMGGEPTKEYTLASPDWLKGGGTTVQQELRTMKAKFSELPEKFPNQASIVRLGGGPKALKIIPAVCDDAIKALDQGRDVNNRPIDRTDIANGLRRLVSDARQDTGLVATVLNVEGVQLYGQYLNELERIANRIG